MPWPGLRHLPMGGPAVSDFTDAARQQVENELVCPSCLAYNRPGVIVVEMDSRRWTAVCNVCAFDGPVKDFQPKEPDV